jgi:hypothetical protein
VPTALQALRDALAVAPGNRVFISGGAGGVGTLAIQLVVWMGGRGGYHYFPAERTSTCWPVWSTRASLRTVTDRLFPFEKIAEGFAYLEQGHAKARSSFECDRHSPHGTG